MNPRNEASPETRLFHLRFPFSYLNLKESQFKSVEPLMLSRGIIPVLRLYPEDDRSSSTRPGWNGLPIQDPPLARRKHQQ